MPIQIFEYVPQLDCFKLNNEFKLISQKIGLKEWNDVVWIGRYFFLDNDYGEHWFDNWDLRDQLENEATKIGLDINDLFVIDPKRFMNSQDGPCHTDEERKRFWTDVLRSFTLSLETIFTEARKQNLKLKNIDPSFEISDLENRIKEIQNFYNA